MVFRFVHRPCFLAVAPAGLASGHGRPTVPGTDISGDYSGGMPVLRKQEVAVAPAIPTFSRFRTR